MSFNKSAAEALNLANQGQVNDAFILLENAIKKDANNPILLNLLGMFNFRFRVDLKKAEVLFEQAISLDEKFGPTYINYTDLLKSESRYKQMNEVLKKALETTPLNKARVYYEMGTAFEMQNEYKKGIDHYKEAIKNSLNNQEIATMAKAIQRCEVKEALFTNQSINA